MNVPAMPPALEEFAASIVQSRAEIDGYIDAAVARGDAKEATALRGESRKWDRLLNRKGLRQSG